MAEPQPSKLMMRVRFSSAALRPFNAQLKKRVSKSIPLPNGVAPPTVTANPGKEDQMVTAEFSVTCEAPEGMGQDEVVRFVLGTTIEGELKAVLEAVEPARSVTEG
jgi:hypothetical protein